VAIICPPRQQATIQALLDRPGDDGHSDGGGPVRVLGPDEAKGLEFDVVLVADPDTIGTAVDPRGLFVALTRATQRLHLVTVPAGHDRLPAAAGTGELDAGDHP
jgi:superfamily I DNA/RNA helicase